MRFSEHFGITRGPRDDWFDPVLTVDTRLFVDPFLVYAQEDGEFEGSHTEVIDFFNVAFKRIAKSDGSQSTLGYRKTMSDLVFPETPELCLGYTRRGTLGSGSGKGLARLIAGAIWEAIQAGVTQITHFEEISLLREGFGADRIGDMTANLLRRRVSAYTLHVCERHSIPTWPTFYKRGYYDPQEGRWMPLSVHAPRNPSTGLPLLLVPQQYLRELPTINADDFWDFCWDNENETLRNEFSDDVLRRVSKPEIIRLARRRPHLRRRYLEHVEGTQPAPYDFDRDPQGRVGWYDPTRKYCIAHPLAFEPPSSQDAFAALIDEFVERYQHFVEERSGWQLLWNDDGGAKGEEAAQLLLLGIVGAYCEAHDIDLSREADVGRGEVDFRFSHGHTFRALLEAKLARNSRFWSGLKKQLPAYLGADRAAYGYFLVVVLSDADHDRIEGIREVVEQLNEVTPYRITDIVIDARRGRPSASKL